MTSNDTTPELKHNMEGGMAPKRPFRLFIKRVCIFFLVMYILSLALWVTGNVKAYLDSTQAMLLAVLAWDSILLALFSLIGLVVVIVLPVSRESGGGLASLLIGLLGYLLLLAIGITGAFFGDSILTLAAGLR